MWDSPDVPIVSILAKEFANFDKYYCGYPGSTTPNRMFILSGTSHNCSDTSCTVPTGGFP